MLYFLVSFFFKERNKMEEEASYNLDLKVWILIGNKYIPVGFNPWRDTDGKVEIVKLTDMTDLKIAGTDIVAKSITPQGILEATPAERMELLKKNWRGILQLFDIHIIVFNDRIEIRGFIPPQVIEIPGKKQSEVAQISHSVRGSG
jgi:hypothetical protein